MDGWNKKLYGAFIKHFSGKVNHRKGCVTWIFITVEKDFRLQRDSNLDPTTKMLALISHCASPPVRRKIVIRNGRVTSPERVLVYLKNGDGPWAWGAVFLLNSCLQISIIRFMDIHNSKLVISINQRNNEYP